MVLVGVWVRGIDGDDDGGEEDWKCASEGNARPVCWVPNAQIGIRAKMKIVYLP